MGMVKDEAKEIIDNLPEQATWDDVMYQFYVKKKISESIMAAEEGKVISHEDVKKRLLKCQTIFRNISIEPVLIVLSGTALKTATLGSIQRTVYPCG